MALAVLGSGSDSDSDGDGDGDGDGGAGAGAGNNCKILAIAISWLASTVGFCILCAPLFAHIMPNLIMSIMAPPFERLTAVAAAVGETRLRPNGKRPQRPSS